ncbi:hypothetical protein U9M48_026507 [Paspalum notatum var. saurae]|uniref:Uncharacterized protein n=1 Tax=Paspalum notatum var. saurae TaxID=547442 RepID=A0AAQ3TSY5_PASNO
MELATGCFSARALRRGDAAVRGHGSGHNRCGGRRHDSASPLAAPPPARKAAVMGARTLLLLALCCWLAAAATTAWSASAPLRQDSRVQCTLVPSAEMSAGEALGIEKASTLSMAMGRRYTVALAEGDHKVLRLSISMTTDASELWTGRWANLLKSSLTIQYGTLTNDMALPADYN